MRGLMYVLTVLSVIGLAFWAYRENYTTQTALDDAERLQHQIADARDRLAVLKAEWAYLNRPDRLRDLADLNFEKLQLLPLRPGQFGRIEQVAYPPLDSVVIDNIVEVSNQEGF